MARQQTIHQQIQRVAAAVPAFAGIAMVSGSQQGASPLCLLAGTAEKYAFKLLLDLVPAAFQAFQSCGSDSLWNSLSAGHLIVTGVHILQLVFGAA
jgi:hypothetical protein